MKLLSLIILGSKIWHQNFLVETEISAGTFSSRGMMGEVISDSSIFWWQPTLMVATLESHLFFTPLPPVFLLHCYMWLHLRSTQIILPSQYHSLNHICKEPFSFHIRESHWIPERKPGYFLWLKKRLSLTFHNPTIKKEIFYQCWDNNEICYYNQNVCRTSLSPLHVTTP